MRAACSEGEFISLFRQHGAEELARILKIGVRRVFARRKVLENRLGIVLENPDPKNTRREPAAEARVQFEVKTGIVIAGSDAHYWPGIVSTSHKAFVKFIKEMKPKLVVMNGDIMDGAQISRHPPIGWEHRPTLIEEIETCQERLGEIETASGKTPRVWNLGNHDARFETRLATVAPEYAMVNGVHLKDHFPLWQAAWSCWINDNLVIKHRFRGGIHAPYNNTLWAGKSIATGHLHSQKVMPISDYNGDRWGIDLGTMAHPYGPQFVDYTEDNPKSWREGFCVFIFENGRLLQPQLCRVVEPGLVDYCGRTIHV